MNTLQHIYDFVAQPISLLFLYNPTVCNMADIEIKEQISRNKSCPKTNLGRLTSVELQEAGYK